jgi:hypothetical protein
MENEAARRDRRRAGNWSDGESNPDLLNAIQPTDALMFLIDNELRDKRNRKIAPGVARRLLARAYARSLARERGGAE